MKNLLNIFILSIALMFGGPQLHRLIVKVNPEMHCNKCETKIQKNMMYEKGIQDIETSLKDQTVTFVYDARKTNAENIKKAMKNVGYNCTVVKDEVIVKGKKSKSK